jgi:hypothetical protein
MTSRVRLALSLGIGVLLSTAVLVIAADRPSSDPADFTVHEWGTFTSVAGQDGAAVDWDALGCTNDLPAFVHEFGYRGFKWRLTGTVRMETPVIYFYTAREMEAQVRVAFPMGLITEWYPRAEYEVWQSRDGRAPLRRLPTNLNGIDTSLTSLTGALEWNGIKLHPSSAQALPVERAPSRYYAARETDAAQLTVGGESEKFLFYRGVGRFAVPLRSTRRRWDSRRGQPRGRHNPAGIPLRKSWRPERVSRRGHARAYSDARSASAGECDP